MKEKTTIITIKIPVKLHNQLKIQNVNMSEVTRKALKIALEHSQELPELLEEKL